MNIVSFIKNVSVYGGLAVISRFAALFTAPIIARVFSVEDYGILDVISTTVSMFATLAALNLVSGVFRHYFEKSREDQKTLVSTSFYFFLIISLILTSVLILIASKISLGLFDTTSYELLLVLSFSRLPFILLYTLNLSILRLQQKSRQYALVSILDLILGVGFVLALYYFDTLTLQNIIVGQLLVQIVVALLLIFLLIEHLNFKWSIVFFKEIANYAIPQFPSVIINFIIINSLPILITLIATTHDTGIYALARKIALIFGIMITAFRMAYDPITMKYIASNSLKKVGVYTNNSIKLFSLFLIPFIGYLAVAPLVFPLLFESKFNESLTILGYLSIALFNTGLNNLVGIGIGFTKRTKYISYAQIVAFVFFTILVYPFIHFMGYLGAAYVLAISSFIQLFCVAYFNQKVSGIKVDIKVVVFLSLLFLLGSSLNNVFLSFFLVLLAITYAWYIIRFKKVFIYLNQFE